MTSIQPIRCETLDSRRDDRSTEETTVWSLILGAARLARNVGWTPELGGALAIDPEGRALILPAARCERAHLLWHPETGWYPAARDWDAHALALFDLYLPLCHPPRFAVELIAHLGQSIDGCIATRDGDAQFVTGEANLRHLHRMRALCDAILVGAETVAADDPRLTTRLVPGANPTRIVLDPRRRLPPDRRLFRDGEAPTLVVCDRSCLDRHTPRLGQAELIGIAATHAGLDLDALLAALADRGIRRVFIEGGGATVSRFLEAGRLSRLQIAVAPLLIGTGRPGVRLPPPARMADTLRPRARIFRMGDDVLYDFDLTGSAPCPASATSPGLELARIR